MTDKETFYVVIGFDKEAEVFHVTETDVPGLSAEAASPREMLDVLTDLVPMLLKENGCFEQQNGSPYSLKFDDLYAKRDSVAA